MGGFSRVIQKYRKFVYFTRLYFPHSTTFPGIKPCNFTSSKFSCGDRFRTVSNRQSGYRSVKKILLSAMSCQMAWIALQLGTQYPLPWSILVIPGCEWLLSYYLGYYVTNLNTTPPFIICWIHIGVCSFLEVSIKVNLIPIATGTIEYIGGLTKEGIWVI